MATKIRLARAGSKKRPFYRIVAADVRAPRDGRFIEKLGTYNPLLPKNDGERVVLVKERIQYWLDKGAQPTDRVLRFLDAAGMAKREARNNPKKAVPRPKTLEKAEERKAKLEAKKEADAAAKEAAKAEAEAPKAEDTPVEDASAVDASAETPATDAPAEAPAEDASADAPKEEAPAQDTSAEEAKAEDAPAEEVKAEDAPAEEVKAEETPAEEAPKEDEDNKKE